MLKKTFDIRVRCCEFSDYALEIVSRLKDLRHYEIASQFAKSATSIGANLAESQSARSRKEFIAILNIALMEARETAYWLRVASGLETSPNNCLKELRQEIHEIISILVTIIKNTLRNY